MKLYKIGDIAKLAGVTTVTIRHYDKINLLKPQNRTDGNYRLFTEQDLRKLMFIRNAKHAGLSLDEIKQLFELYEQRAHPPHFVGHFVEKKKELVDHRIKELNHIKRVLDELNALYQGYLSEQDCHILQHLFGEEPSE